MFENKKQDFTPVSNYFIENYMLKARGEFVKVYLLGLKYCVSGEIGVHSTIMASNLSMLETDVINAWNYWNDEGVIKLVPIDNMGNLKIQFMELSEDSLKEDNSVNLLEELNKSSIKGMLQDIEKLICRPLSSKEISMYISWQKDMGFSLELILLLIQYCVSKGKTDSRYIEKIALSWQDSKITNIEEAQMYIKKHEEKWVKLRRILNYLGIKDGEIMKPQEDLLTKWISSYNLPLEVIFKACDICFERLNKADFKYIDAILATWHKEGIKNIEDVINREPKKTAYKKPATTKVSTFNNYEQRSYDFDKLEKDLLGWEDKEKK